MKEKIIGFFSLFGSSATLLCCALPAAVSILAGGAAVGSLITAFPWLIPISRYHHWIFAGTAVLLLLHGILVIRPKRRSVCCAKEDGGCQSAGHFSRAMFWVSVTLYCIGAFFAYAYVPLMRFFKD